MSYKIAILLSTVFIAFTSYGQDQCFVFPGDGLSDTTAYQISSPAQLAMLAESVNRGEPVYGAFFMLTADIDLSSYGSGWNNGKGWIPIGTGESFFIGQFDGNNHKVSGLYINDNNPDCAGLFGRINFGGSVRNISVECNITGNGLVGGVAGQVGNNSSIINCNVTGTVRGNIYVGGIAGEVSGSIIDCYSTCEVNGNIFVGGVAGTVPGAGIATNCYATGVVSGGDAIGGVSGSVTGSLTKCYATGEVSGNEIVGGVVGNVQGSVTHCYAKGAVSGNRRVGGIAGSVSIAGMVTDCEALNPSVMRSSGFFTSFGSIAGDNEGTLSGNPANVESINTIDLRP